MAGSWVHASAPAALPGRQPGPFHAFVARMFPFIAPGSALLKIRRIIPRFDRLLSVSHCMILDLASISPTGSGVETAMANLAVGRDYFFMVLRET